MKNFITMFLSSTLLFFSSSVWAQTPYKWVPLTDSQLEAVNERCQDFDKTTMHAASLILSPVAILAVGTTFYVRAMRANPDVTGLIEITLPALAIGGSIAPAITGVSKLYDYLTPPEVYELVLEQQMDMPGIFTHKLKQISEDIGADANFALASFNKAAILNKICLPRFYEAQKDPVGADNISDIDFFNRHRLQVAKEIQENLEIIRKNNLENQMTQIDQQVKK